MDVAVFEAMINDAERKCIDDTISPWEIDDDEEYKIVLFYYDGIRTMANVLRQKIRDKSSADL